MLTGIAAYDSVLARLWQIEREYDERVKAAKQERQRLRAKLNAMPQAKSFEFQPVYWNQWKEIDRLYVMRCRVARRHADLMQSITRQIGG